MEFIKGFKVNERIYLDGQIVTVVMVDGEVHEGVTLSTSALKKIGFKVEGEKGERVFDLKEVETIR